MHQPDELPCCAVVGMRYRSCELFHKPGGNFAAVGKRFALEGYGLVRILWPAFSSQVSKYFEVLPGAVFGGAGLHGLTPDLLLPLFDLPGNFSFQLVDGSICWVNCALHIPLRDHASGVFGEAWCEVWYLTLWDVSSRGLQQDFSEDCFSRITRGWGRLFVCYTQLIMLQ